MKTLMRNGRDRRSENPRCATRGKNACFWLGPISGSHQGPQPERLHSEAEYMAAPERFAETSNSFPLHRGRRPYMAHHVFAPHCSVAVAIGADRTWTTHRGDALPAARPSYAGLSGPDALMHGAPC